MARHLVSLRIALLRAGVRSAGPWRSVGLVASLLAGAALGLLGAWSLSLARQAPDAVAVEAVYGSTAFVFVLWVLGPLLTPGGGAGLDPARLALFPLRRTQLLTGLLGAACIGAGGVATVMVLFGAATATAVNATARLVALPAIALALATCVVASQLVATAISSLASTRRYRDVALFIAPVLGISLQLLGRVSGSAASTDGRGLAVSRGLRMVGRVLPSGWSARAMVDARLGDPVGVVIGLVGGAVVLALLFLAWGVVLERALVAAGPSGPSERKRRGTGPGRRQLFPWLVRWWPRRRWSAVAAKDLRLLWRDPRQRAFLISTVFYGTFPLVSAVLSSRRTGEAVAATASSVLLAVAPAFMLGAGSTNLYGFDGAAHWANVAAGDDARSDLYGKQAARLVVVAVVTVVLAVVLGVRADALSIVPAVVAVALGAFGLSVGLASYVSVRVPFSVPASRTNLFATGDTGRGFASVLPSLGVVLGAGAVIAPLVVMFLAALDDGGGSRAAGEANVGIVAVAALALAAGAAGWAAATEVAVRASAGRQPELLAALTRR